MGKEALKRMLCVGQVVEAEGVSCQAEVDVVLARERSYKQVTTLDRQPTNRS